MVRPVIDACGSTPDALMALAMIPEGCRSFTPVTVDLACCSEASGVGLNAATAAVAALPAIVEG
jgi:hypothetical protein